MRDHHVISPSGELLPTWFFLTFHEALRRDLGRFTGACAALAGGRPIAVTPLQAHWRHHRALLEAHHETEDEQLFPMLRTQEPALRPLLDELDAQHHALDEVLERVTRLVDRLEQPGVAVDAEAAFGELAALLLPHLAAEEEHLVPVLLARFPPLEIPPDGAPLPQLLSVPAAFVHPWALDGLDEHVLDVALASLPAADRQRHPSWVAAYREALAMWAPAAAEPSPGLTTPR